MVEVLVEKQQMEHRELQIQAVVAVEVAILA